MVNGNARASLKDLPLRAGLVALCVQLLQIQQIHHVSFRLAFRQLFGFSRYGSVKGLCHLETFRLLDNNIRTCRRRLTFLRDLWHTHTLPESRRYRKNFPRQCTLYLQATPRSQGKPRCARPALTPPGALLFHTASRHANWPCQCRRLSLRSFFGKNIPIYTQGDRTLALTASHSCRFVSVSGSTVS